MSTGSAADQKSAKVAAAFAAALSYRKTKSASADALRLAAAVGSEDSADEELGEEPAEVDEVGGILRTNTRPTAGTESTRL